jgi:hypothetical protein
MLLDSNDPLELLTFPYLTFSNNERWTIEEEVKIFVGSYDRPKVTV